MVRGLLIAAVLAIAPISVSHAAEAKHPPKVDWTFAGPFGTFEQGAVQRGFQVYKEVCATCHGMRRIAFRNLYEAGGPGFPEEGVKALAATFKVMDGPNDDGKMFERPAKPSDRFPSPYQNEKEARSIHNGAYPPDLSVMAKARGIENTSPWYQQLFWDMPRDIVMGYQEGGADYVYAVLTSYADAPSSFTMADGMNYNKAFPGYQIAMANPFAGGDGLVKYTKGADGRPGAPETVDQYSRDVTAFLMWAADPTLEQRKSMGWAVMIYLLVTSLLLFIAKKRVWASAH